MVYHLFCPRIIIFHVDPLFKICIICVSIHPRASQSGLRGFYLYGVHCCPIRQHVGIWEKLVWGKVCVLIMDV